jgi:hypothetical protein
MRDFYCGPGYFVYANGATDKLRVFTRHHDATGASVWSEELIEDHRQPLWTTKVSVANHFFLLGRSYDGPIAYTWDGDQWSGSKTYIPEHVYGRRTAHPAGNYVLVVDRNSLRARTWVWDGTNWAEAVVDGAQSGGAFLGAIPASVDAGLNMWVCIVDGVPFVGRRVASEWRVERPNWEHGATANQKVAVGDGFFVVTHSDGAGVSAFREEGAGSGKWIERNFGTIGLTGGGALNVATGPGYFVCQNSLGYKAFIWNGEMWREGERFDYTDQTNFGRLGIEKIPAEETQEFCPYDCYRTYLDARRDLTACESGCSQYGARDGSLARQLCDGIRYVACRGEPGTGLLLLLQRLR